MGDVPIPEKEAPTTTINTWNKNHFASDKLVSHAEEVRIIAIELTMAYFQERIVLPSEFFNKAKQMERFILDGGI